MNTGEWAWSQKHNEICRILEVQTIWGQDGYLVWFPEKEIVKTVPAEDLSSVELTSDRFISPHIIYLVTAARIRETLKDDVLLAPIESSVIPLPHQLRALSQAISDDSVRFLLADEVGLGKTIEAGLILRELKLRGLVKRTLVVAPRGLVIQWASEMKSHFSEDFKLLIPSDLSSFRRMSGEDNAWRMFDQVICPMDSIKPIEGRQGWSKEQTADYNRNRFEDLVSAGWDLIIVDEAHRLGGSHEEVARHKLGQGLADAAPYLLLLSATPHQGKTDAFHRLVSLLDQNAFPNEESVTRDRIYPYVIRTEKRAAINDKGEPLFQPRTTQLENVSWQDRHQGQKTLYNAVTEYVQFGYNQALKEKKTYVGFLMILLQRLVTSSTSAIRNTLQRRLEALEMPEEQLSLFPLYTEEEWSDLDAQEQINSPLITRLKALKNEREEVKLLLEIAERCIETANDAKAEALLEWIYRLQQEEVDPDLKILVFTEFVRTQEMIQEFLSKRGFSVVILNGSMDMEERRQAEETFAKEAQIMVSTEAGGEGLNLQFCHVVINYDIPWNPMRLEQRIGRVDRIGQTSPVRVINFVLEDTVEHRVLAVLEAKLSIILREFGVDKTGDVLDSAQASRIFDRLYMGAILRPGKLDEELGTALEEFRVQANETKENMAILGKMEDLDPELAQRVKNHPLPHWVEQMTVSFLKANGGQATKSEKTWNLQWPDGYPQDEVVFTIKDLEDTPGAKHITLDQERIRNLVNSIPLFVPGLPIPTIGLPDLPEEVKGLWSLWQIAIKSENFQNERIMPLFLNHDGRVLKPTARIIWDHLMAVPFDISGYLDSPESVEAYNRMIEQAEIHGEEIFQELKSQHQTNLQREWDKCMYAFDARKRVIERIGLPAVREHRLKQLQEENNQWKLALKEKESINPELSAILLLQIG